MMAVILINTTLCTKYMIFFLYMHLAKCHVFPHFPLDVVYLIPLRRRKAAGIPFSAI